MKTESPQSTFDFARTGRDAGMNLVAVHAGQDWCERAYRALVCFAQANKTFMTEDVRAYAVKNGVSVPHDNRAWGSVVVRAVKDGVISRSGYAPSKTGHMRPMPMWASANAN